MMAMRRRHLSALGALRHSAVLASGVLGGRHRAVVPRVGYPDGFVVWSFAVIDDLRPRTEIEDDHQRGVQEVSGEYATV